MKSTLGKPRSPTALQLKQSALQLFAERGIDGVTVRQIAEAAGQKNHAVVGYYFGSKEALIHELIVDGAREVDERRNAALDALEAKDEPITLLDVMEILVRTSVQPEPSPDECYNRFVVNLQQSHRTLFMDALGGRWNSGYQRCLAHFRRILSDVPTALLNQRLVFLGAALGGIMAIRESELSDRSRQHRTWSSDATLAHIARSMAAMLEQDRLY